jgi:hypothetical protein
MDGQPPKTPEPKTPVTDLAKLNESLPVPAVNVISGTDTLLDSKNHIGIAVRVKSAGGPSVLVIPDVAGVKEGTNPVYITRPLKLELANLQAFLTAKGVDLPDSIKRLLNDASVACNAFYFTAKNGPLLMQFALQFDEGLIKSLTGDEDIGKLFDVEGVSVRVFRCSEAAFPNLQKYAAELTAAEPKE